MFEGSKSALGFIVGSFLLFVLAPVIIVVLGVRFLFSGLILALIHVLWLPRGKNCLVVYSESPYWQSYFENGLVPRLAVQSYVLNHSQRKSWNSFDLATLAFLCFAGEREYNPLVFVFHPFRLPKRFRFYEAFRDYKHGKIKKLNEIETKLSDCLSIQLDISKLPRT